MSESIHAVVSNKAANHQSSASNAASSSLMPSNSPKVAENEQHHHLADEDDEDDEVDVIGKFEANNRFVASPPSSSGLHHPLGHPSSSSSSSLFHPISIQTRLRHVSSDSTHHPLTPTSSNRFHLYDSVFEPVSNVGPGHVTGTSLKLPPSDGPSSTGQPSGTTTAPTTGNEWQCDSSLVESRNRLRRVLRYQFMSPLDKWRIKGRFPWKLLFQVVKIILVTTQVVFFGASVTSVHSVDNSMIMTMHNLFLLKWDSSRDFKSIPPDNGPYAIYTKEELYQHIDYAVRNYVNITALSYGSFGYQVKPNSGQMSVMDFCYQRYRNATLMPSASEYFLDLEMEEECLHLDNLYPPGSAEWTNFSSLAWIAQNGKEQLDMSSLQQLILRLPLRVIMLNTIGTFGTPQCFDLDLAIHFDNRPHSGELAIGMAIHKMQLDCNGNLQDASKEAHLHNANLAINFMVLALCLFSFVLCTRTLIRAQSLRRRTARFFAVAFKRSLDAHSAFHFIDGWILMIVLNDCLLISGSTINILRRFSLIGPHRLNSMHPVEWDSLCSALLGLGNLLVWCGLLRYLAFFHQYNVLVVTIKHSLPRVLRFLLCVMVLYSGFCFSGWIILGPYHFKFSSLARTSECLFALMNGDDVFATFAYLQNSSPFVWWFSRVYLYTFVLLFIYVVLSLFIAILMDSYETIKDYYGRRAKSRLRSDFLLANDLLSQFLVAKFEPDDDPELDTVSHYRLDLLRDEDDSCPTCQRPRCSWLTSSFAYLARVICRRRQPSSAPNDDGSHRILIN